VRNEEAGSAHANEDRFLLKNRDDFRGVAFKTEAAQRLGYRPQMHAGRSKTLNGSHNPKQLKPMHPVLDLISGRLRNCNLQQVPKATDMRDFGHRNFQPTCHYLQLLLGPPAG
jgi:hypothetical protein